MKTITSESIRNNYDEVSALCKSSREPVYLTKNGKNDLVVMDITTFERLERTPLFHGDMLGVQDIRLEGVPMNEDTGLDDIVEDIFAHRFE